ncbi:ammonia-forming cytochrome c nitrite reductase subunit c552 [Haloferula sp. A504]|uniref:ammonia-forming cytochrome c nitrite reductase subunit c552 n=1 Tax=Haloferula sp. A504 TaxID=3373601 RepID=UPI0031CA683E|nr:ammonia-forming cytochrome c nitrite reductase subunit c552 [Verrucomicrobiaceae bacterium E54]
MRRLLLSAPLALIFAACGEKEATPVAAEEAPPVVPPPLTDPSTLAESSRCIACHQDAHESWMGSHHQLAHRDVGNEVDEEAFAGHEVTVGDAHWTFSGGAEKPTIHWDDKQDTDAEPVDANPPMAIGYTPLVQYLVAKGNGRYQIPDMSWDPAAKEWFSIYDDQNRRPNEWGHWLGRGMNWNSQCAYCHFTGLRKNHDPETDGYKTNWIEQGVGCAQCHGPSRPEAKDGECLVDPKQKFTTEQWTHSCATCHARREEFDEEFTTGRSFHDHYGTALPSQPGLWFADGQQLDEIYKFNSLMMSRMGHKGIGCNDCHEPHAATPIGGDPAVRTNALCMTCHVTGKDEATVIDPLTHAGAGHPYGKEGSACVDCHMPKRNYMSRDPRSDHRFPIPDPLLTKELGVPNACNDCHADKGLDWQIEWTHKYYGEDMNQVSRKRSRAVHAGQQGETGALDQLVEAAEVEEIDAWRATLLRLMEPWATDSRVVRLTNRFAHEGGPLARAAAGLLVARRGETGGLLEKLLSDPIKAVRVETGWAAFERLPSGHAVIAELEKIARHQSDQPGGAMRMARILISRDQLEEAEKWFRKACDWDRTSPAPRRDFAVFLGGIGRTAESVEWLEKAIALAPENPEIPYLAALAYAEIGESLKAEAKLGDAVRIDPGFARAWYNLGLLYAGQNRVNDAIRALRRAGDADTSSPDAPYARATIHLRMGQVDQAREAAAEALRRDPNHGPSMQLLRELGG